MPLLLLLFSPMIIILFLLINIILFTHLICNLWPLQFITIYLQILLRDWLLFLHFFLHVVEDVDVDVDVDVAMDIIIISFLYGMLIRTQLFILLYDFCCY
jgi:hypothetical protein